MAAIPALIGIACWGGGFFSFFKAIPQTGGVRLLAPGVTVVTITNMGEYTIWNQTRGIVDGQFKTFSEKLPQEMTVTVMKKKDGTKIPLQSAARSSMENNGTKRESVASLTFPVPGQYLIEITGLADEHALYLDKPLFDSGMIHGIMNGVFMGFAGMVFLVTAFGVGIYGFVRLMVKKPASR